jgi:hypothetical protein
MPGQRRFAREVSEAARLVHRASRRIYSSYASAGSASTIPFRCKIPIGRAQYAPLSRPPGLKSGDALASQQPFRPPAFLRLKRCAYIVIFTVYDFHKPCISAMGHAIERGVVRTVSQAAPLHSSMSRR